MSRKIYLFIMIKFECALTEIVCVSYKMTGIYLYGEWCMEINNIYFYIENNAFVVCGDDRVESRTLLYQCSRAH